MRRQNIALIAVNLILIVGTTLAGMIFVPETNSPDGNKNSYLQPVEIHRPAPIRTKVAEFHTFGSEAGESFFLKLAASSQDIQIGYQLVAAPIEGNLFTGDVPANALHCSSAGAPVVASPAGINMEVTAVKQPATAWEELSSWFSPPTYDPFVISMWVPSSEMDKYTLVGLDEAWIPKNCVGLLDKDV